MGAKIFADKSPVAKNAAETPSLTRCSAPFYVQFELTERCNNRCFFCYNEIGTTTGEELSFEEVIRILDEMSDAGVFKINFNGGEPLARDDIFDICSYAHNLGIQLHMNTNATLITNGVAKRISEYMPSVCTSLLSSDPERHDAMSGRVGAFDEAIRGIGYLRRHGVGVEVNVCTSMDNYKELYSIAEVAASHGCYAICATRYILTDTSQTHLVMTEEATVELIGILERIEREIDGIEDVSLPGPVPLCEVSEKWRDKLKALNVPCQYGYGLCRVSATGIVTPCTISSHELANLKKISFKRAWNVPGWKRYIEMKHITEHCNSCEELMNCGAGCIVYDDCLVNNSVTPVTRKWTGVLS